MPAYSTVYDFADPSILIKESKDMSYDKALGGMAATIAKQVSDNLAVVNHRSSRLRLSMTVTTFGFLILFLTATFLIYVYVLPQ